MLRLLLLFVLLVVSSLLVACGNDASADEPPKINYGRDVCDRCHMIISEERYASGLVDSDGESLIFDDAGEMIAMVQEDVEKFSTWRVWVHDYNSVEWIDGTEAFYVDARDVITPMGTGIIAFEGREAAEAFAAERGGRVLDWHTAVAEWEIHGP